MSDEAQGPPAPEATMRIAAVDIFLSAQVISELVGNTHAKLAHQMMDSVIEKYGPSGLPMLNVAAYLAFKSLARFFGEHPQVEATLKLNPTLYETLVDLLLQNAQAHVHKLGPKIS